MRSLRRLHCPLQARRARYRPPPQSCRLPPQAQRIHRSPRILRGRKFGVKRLAVAPQILKEIYLPKNTFHLVSLGCAKNTVDSDSMAQLLLREGYRAVEAPSRANVLIVNTCGFIGPAKEESINVLRELAQGKEQPNSEIGRAHV